MVFDIIGWFPLFEGGHYTSADTLAMEGKSRRAPDSARASSTALP
jgi:hypothetical protein